MIDWIISFAGSIFLRQIPSPRLVLYLNDNAKMIDNLHIRIFSVISAYRLYTKIVFYKSIMISDNTLFPAAIIHRYISIRYSLRLLFIDISKSKFLFPQVKLTAKYWINTPWNLSIARFTFTLVNSMFSLAIYEINKEYFITFQF